MSSTVKYLIRIQAILFVCFLIISFYFNRFAVDDYFFIGEINSKSFSEIYSNLYLNWHGRWTSNFLLLFFIQLYKIPFFLFIYNLLCYGLMVFTVNRLFKAINNYNNLAITSTFVYTVIFTSIFFFCTVNANETWFWFTSSVVYFWSVIAFFFSAKIFFEFKPNWTTYLSYILGLIYIGGSNEPMAILILLVFTLLFIKSYKRKMVLIGVVTLLTSFLINYLSKGTINREEITPGLSLFSLALYSGYNTLKYLFFNFHITFQIAIVLSVPFYILGKHSSYNKSQLNVTKELVYGILLIGLVTFLNQFIVTFSLGGLAPDRSAISTSVFISIVITRFFFLLGSYSKSTKKVVYYVPLWGCLYLLVFVIYFSSIHYNYNKADKERIATIKSSSDELIVLEKLPESGYLYCNEISTDASDFKNQHLKNGVGIKNDLVLKPN